MIPAELLGSISLNTNPKHKKTLQTFIKTIQTQYDIIVKTFRSDNGSEFTSKECQQIFMDFGILHQRTTPYTPQQNGRVEMKHRDLLKLARSLLFQASLPSQFWGDVLLTVTYILNRLPTLILSWKSPFEVLTNKIPDYSFLRTFGCL